MADAAQYAQWLVDNQGKKGTPEFDTVAQAYRAARSASTSATPTATGIGDRLASTGQAALSGFMLGGLPAVPFAAMAEGQRQLSEETDRVAYGTGGKVTDFATKAGASPEVAAGLGLASNVAVGALPMVVGGATSKVLQPGFQKAAMRVMQSAVKPSSAALKSGDWARAGKTMLEKGVGATKSGMQKLDDLIEKAVDRVDDAIDAVGPGRMVNRNFIKQELITELRNIRKRLDVGEDPRVVAKLWQRIKSRFDQMIPLQRAQEAKKAEMAFLRNKNVYQKDLNPSLLAGREAAARGLKKGIEDVIPEIKEINRELGNLLATRKVVAPKVDISGNKDLVGAFAPISIAAARGDPIGGGMAALQLADRNPWFKSWLARGLYNTPRPLGMTGGGALAVDRATEPPGVLGQTMPR